MSYKLYLDDVRPVPEGWVGVNNFNDFVKTVKKRGMPDFVSFDHDLTYAHYDNLPTKEKTGYDAAKWLIEYCERNGIDKINFNVHSANYIAVAAITFLLESFNKKEKGISK